MGFHRILIYEIVKICSYEVPKSVMPTIHSSLHQSINYASFLFLANPRGQFQDMIIISSISGKSGVYHFLI